MKVSAFKRRSNTGTKWGKLRLEVLEGRLLPDSAFGASLGHVLSSGSLSVHDSSATGTPPSVNAPATATPSLSINSVAVVEGNSGATPATFTVTLSSPSLDTVTVDFTTVAVTATSGTDYVPTSGTLSFAPGQTTQTINVSVIGDTVRESNETFFVFLTNPSGASIAVQLGLGTIIDDDATPTLSINDVSVVEGNNGLTSALFTVSLSNPSQDTVAVDFTTADGTASASSGDYVTNAGTLSFAPGTTVQTLTILVNGDTVFEPNETFFVNLSNPTNAVLADNLGAGTILNDDGMPSISINDVSIAEGDTGSRQAIFTVTLSNPSQSTATVDFATSDGTATAGLDYTASATQTLTFNPGETSKTITVAVLGDFLSEQNETFFVNLSNASSNATIATPRGTGTIVDDDGLPALSINSATVTEGNSGTTPAVFTVSLAAPSPNTVTVDFSTLDGTATAGSDYAANSGTLTFNPGETTKLIAIMVDGEIIREPDETFFVNLSNAVNAAISRSQGVGTIINDDEVPQITINDVSVVEGNNGLSSAFFTVGLSNPSQDTVTVDFATTDGSATASSGDYVAHAGTLSFAPGTTVQTVTILINGDSMREQDETFFVNLSNPGNSIIADSSAVGTIINDDPLPKLSITDAGPVLEGNPESTISATFTVRLLDANDQPVTSGETVTVNFVTADGTATAGSGDYMAISGTLIFAPGEMSHTVTVLVNGDNIHEPDESFFVNLTNAANGTIGVGQGSAIILNDDELPGLSIDSATVTEGNSGTTDAIFTVTLSAPTQGVVTVNYTTVDGSATAGSDYIANAGSLTFAPGETTKTITIQVNGDILRESNETFFVNLSNPTNASLASAQGMGTIVDDDPLPTISINDVSITEGNTGFVSAVFTVTLSNPSQSMVIVDFRTADATATANSGDYLPNTGSLIFAPGTTTQTITVLVAGDLVRESNETFFINLLNPTNASIADDLAIGTIINDDALPALSINDIEVVEGDTGSRKAFFTVTLSNPSQATVTVDFMTSNGTATAGLDYVANSGTLTFTPGKTSKTITVFVLGDFLSEQNETFFVNLSNSANATIDTSSGTGTILDNDGLPSLSINHDTVTEGNSGTVPAVFIVNLSSPSPNTVTVDFNSLDGTATVGSDYVANSGTLTFNPGDTSKTITIMVNGDIIREQNEHFFVVLSNPVNAGLSSSLGVGTIVNDDPLPSLSINDVSVLEGNSGFTSALFTVTLSNPSQDNVTVNFVTSDGTASAASGDYLPLSGTLVFVPGATTQTIAVVVQGDMVGEPDETFFVNLSNPANGGLADGQGIGTIVNDDAQAVTLSINDVSVTEGNSGTTNAVFTVSLSAASPNTVTVDFATADGTATASSGDYASTSGTLTFSPGTTTQTITVMVNGDTLNEPDEIFTVNLSNPANATITDSQGIGSILNDDPVPSLSINNVSVTEGNSGTTNAVFTVTLSAASGQTVLVQFATADGSATASSGDYISNSGTLTFSPGTTTQTITVTVNGDTLNEPDETFFVNLFNSTNATIAGSQGTGTIVNDDLPSLSINNVSVTEGNSGTTNAVFTVTLSAPSPSTVTVHFATADGSATVSGGDYNANSGTLTFTPGTTTQTITVTVNGDTTTEPDENFFVVLSSPTNATIAVAQGTGTILNDDGLPQVNINSISMSEGNSGTTAFTFTVTLTAASTSTVTVGFVTQDGTASASSGDYLSTSGTVTFSPGQTSKTITVLVNGDTLVEANETFFVQLQNPMNAVLGKSPRGKGTIINDDGTIIQLQTVDLGGVQSPGEKAALVAMSYSKAQISQGWPFSDPPARDVRSLAIMKALADVEQKLILDPKLLDQLFLLE